MQHIIKREVLEFSVNSGADAFRMQQSMNNYNKTEILPALEKIFNELATEDELIEMEKLEIDLGIVFTSETEIETPADLYELIEIQVRKAINSKRVNLSLPVQNSRVIGLAWQWLFYMEKGYLPWNTLNADQQWYDAVLEAFAVDFESIAALRELIKRNSAAVKRIVYQHTGLFIEQLVQVLTAERHSRLLLTLEEMLEDPMVKSSGKRLENGDMLQSRQQIMALIIKAAASGSKGLTTSVLKNIVMREIQDNVQNSMALIVVDGEVLTIIKPEEPVIRKEIRNKKEDVELYQEVDAGKKEIEKDGIFVHHAGLVLIHPFLHSFFKKLQFVNEGSFVNSDFQQKALYLLYYLATGKKEPEEYELVIPKLLCEYELTQPVDKNVKLVDEEILEADGMLEAVIDQWTILKNTSVDGLREGFLQRNGKYYSKNANLHLQVERGSIDMLLDYLPWNLSIIKLPWMKEILRVEWS